MLRSTNGSGAACTSAVVFFCSNVEKDRWMHVPRHGAHVPSDPGVGVGEVHPSPFCPDLSDGWVRSHERGVEESRWQGLLDTGRVAEKEHNRHVDTAWLDLPLCVSPLCVTCASFCLTKDGYSVFCDIYLVRWSRAPSLCSCVSLSCSLPLSLTILSVP